MDYKAARQIMVDSQIRPNDVANPHLVSALLSVPREKFVPKPRRSVAYSELEIETSEGRALWIPRDFAKLLKAVEPASSDIALVIGAGAGYETAVLARLVETAIGLEDTEALVTATGERLAEFGNDRAVIVEGALDAGLAAQGPFDVIFVNGMVQSVPESWTDQLSELGRLGVVVQTGAQLGEARVYTRSNGIVSYRKAFEASPPRFAMFDSAASFSF
ncbi:MAG: protein-L-isoaspartate O-methyltransferase [Hyphomonadaceae bacterium]